MNQHIRNNFRVSVVYWLALAGIGIWIALAASGLVPESPPVQIGPFLVVLLLETLNLAGRSYERFQRDRRGDEPYRRFSLYSWLFVTIDLVLIAVGLHYTGGIRSPLWVVIFLIGVAETLLAPAAEAYAIRYGMILSLTMGTLPGTFAGFNGGYFLEMGVRVGSFLAVSSVARRLRVNHEARTQENASLRSELSLAEERSHLSREVHDGVGNSLAAAVLRLEFAAHQADKAAQTETAALLRDEAQSLRTAMNAIRDWTFFTRPWSAIDSDTLAPSARLTAEIDRLARRTGLAITVTGAECLDTCQPPTRLAVLRIAQEALTNTAKHAQATSANVTLCRDRHVMLLTISDNGAGFVQEGGPDCKAGAGIGLSSMRERAEGLGGSFSLESTPGNGTTLTARLPAG